MRVERRHNKHAHAFAGGAMSHHAGNRHLRNVVVTIAVILRHGVASKLLPTISLVPGAALPALHQQLFVLLSLYGTHDMT